MSIANEKKNKKNKQFQSMWVTEKLTLEYIFNKPEINGDVIRYNKLKHTTRQCTPS